MKSRNLFSRTAIIFQLNFVVEIAMKCEYTNLWYSRGLGTIHTLWLLEFWCPARLAVLTLLVVGELVAIIHRLQVVHLGKWNKYVCVILSVQSCKFHVNSNYDCICSWQRSFTLLLLLYIIHCEDDGKKCHTLLDSIASIVCCCSRSPC